MRSGLSFDKAKELSFFLQDSPVSELPKCRLVGIAKSKHPSYLLMILLGEANESQLNHVKYMLSPLSLDCEQPKF